MDCSEDHDPYADLDAGVVACIRAYRPRSLDTAVWRRWEVEARALVARSGPGSAAEAKGRLSAFVGLLAVAEAEGRTGSLEQVFDRATRARHEELWTGGARTLERHRGRLDVLSAALRGEVRARGRSAPRARRLADPAVVVELLALAHEEGTPEAVVRFVVAGVGAGLERAQAYEARLGVSGRGPVVVTPRGRRRVAAEVVGAAAGLERGALLHSSQRRAAEAWLAERGVEVPGHGALHARWVADVASRPVPVVELVSELSLSRSELALVAEVCPEPLPGEADLLRGAPRVGRLARAEN